MQPDGMTARNSAGGSEISGLPRFSPEGAVCRAGREDPANTTGEMNMSDHVYKKFEIVGSSRVSSDEAIRNAVKEAGKSVQHMHWYEVKESRGYIDGDGVSYFQVTLSIGHRA